MLTMEEYLQQHDFLQEPAKVYTALEKMATKVIEKEFPLPEEAVLQNIADKGLPLLQEKPFQEKMISVSAAALKKIVQEMHNIEVNAEMKQAAKLLAEKFSEDEDLSTALMECIITQDLEKLSEECKEFSVAENFILLWGWNAVSAILPKEIKKRDVWTKVKYRRNYCPVCGRQPVMAQLVKEADGKARFLSCDGCHTQWPFDRTGCVYCGNDDLRKIKVMEPVHGEKIRLYACEECKSYLKTYVEEDEEDIFLKDWATMHFDILGEEAGFHKLGSAIMG